jgi:hypothetical protein
MTINLKELKGYLAINKAALDDELVHQSEIFCNVGEAYIEAVDQRDALKEDLGIIEAELDNEIREKADLRDEKITNDGVKARVRSDPKRKIAYRAYAVAKRKADRLGVLKESFLQRASMLKHLCELYVANYYEQNSFRGTDRQDTAVYMQRRMKMDQARKQDRMRS